MLKRMRITIGMNMLVEDRSELKNLLRNGFTRLLTLWLR